MLIPLLFYVLPMSFKSIDALHFLFSSLQLQTPSKRTDGGKAARQQDGNFSLVKGNDAISVPPSSALSSPGDLSVPAPVPDHVDPLFFFTGTSPCVHA
jgi:hypothetical protein